jgi:hypothetical protein
MIAQMFGGSARTPGIWVQGFTVAGGSAGAEWNAEFMGPAVHAGGAHTRLSGEFGEGSLELDVLFDEPVPVNAAMASTSMLQWDAVLRRQARDGLAWDAQVLCDGAGRLALVDVASPQFFLGEDLAGCLAGLASGASLGGSEWRLRQRVLFEGETYGFDADAQLRCRVTSWLAVSSDQVVEAIDVEAINGPTG